MAQSYDQKGEGYFANARVEIEPLLAARAARALEIGCGAGATMHWLRRVGRVERAWGIELFESAAAQAREHFDTVLAGDAEKLIATEYRDLQFDLILCLDVLEHMVDPWQFVKDLQGLLAPGGKLVISVPNIRCLRVLLPLLLKGRWQYADDGILDRTHLRFFTREGALELAAGGNLRVERCLESRPRGSRLEKLHRWTFGTLRDLTAFQYLISSSRAPESQWVTNSGRAQAPTHSAARPNRLRDESTMQPVSHPEAAPVR